ncbi:putative two-component system response regulator [Caenispirillum salinarum AK4]|uniref:Putative two-component system response regulator n=1 Tax=Caenispirillum salinarum AK4 TaxID=1238182 RepID=K9HQR4_9PROT|nr:response regulator transcription factor [Caenispirillum salinarum]EKV30771.1 putative two-component system response regulator [Caenispirillum salinarum AK4]
MRIILADDHSIIRAALRAVVSDIEPTAEIIEARSFPELEAAVADTPEGTPAADLLVMDLRMPGYTGQDQVGDLVRRLAPCPVAVFSMTEDPAAMRATLAQGVRAFIPKSTEHAVLGGVLRIVLAGGTYVPPELGMAPADASAGVGGPAAAPGFSADSVGRGAVRPDPVAQHPVVASLTRRQRQVMELLGEGLSNAEICERLGLNLSTVKAHVSGVLRALNVDSRTQAALRIREIMGWQ